MQAIYFPSRVLTLNKDERFQVSCNHDEYSLWFDVHATTTEPFVGTNSEERSLGMTLISRNRLSQLNDYVRNKMFLKLIKKVTFLLRNFLKF
jgi:protein arginine N-methyltransferase 7